MIEDEELAVQRALLDFPYMQFDMRSHQTICNLLIYFPFLTLPNALLNNAFPLNSSPQKTLIKSTTCKPKLCVV